MPLPPPPPPGIGPPKPLTLMKVKPPGSDHNALLSSIQKGTNLKKTVTNDRSSPSVNGKAKTNGSPTTSVSIANGGAPQLGGLFAGGMPKLRSTGRGIGSSLHSGNKPAIRPALPPTRKPISTVTHQPPKPEKPVGLLTIQRTNPSNLDKGSPEPSNGFLPSSPKPSMKSNPAPPPPPASRKPNQDPQRLSGSFAEAHNKPAPPRPPKDVISTSLSERNPPLPAKPSGLYRIVSSSRGAPPRPPMDPPQKSYLKQNGDARRVSIDRSKSMREPFHLSTPTNVRIGTSAESPAAPYRTLVNSHSNRPAPPIPSNAPFSKTVGRVAGNAMLSTIRAPKPPTRPTIMAPPPPSQPPPPPPHRTNQLPVADYVKTDVMTTGAHIAPPLPPDRVESTRLSSNRNSGDFESKFLSKFKSRHQFPLPLTFSNIPKNYPSKNNVKRQRRAPQPPTHLDQSQASSHSTPHHTPPPPPPHAPIHLQVGRKFYGTETSQC